MAIAPAGDISRGRPPIPRSLLALPTRRASMPCPAVADDEGLLHDARNLIGALSLYCDLLSMPGVLKMEHRHYADEVRQLGARSAAMIQQLMEHSVQAQGAAACSWLSKSSKPGDVNAHPVQDTLPTGAAAAKRTESAPSPVSLRNIVERCSGLLGRVACGSAVEISFGVAAAAPVSVGEETVERILVNLVRNSAAALAKREPACAAADLNGRDDGSVLGDSAQKTVSAPRCSVHEVDADPTADETPGSIRIGVGLLANRVGDARPWPFRRVRLTVEDSGCGMAPEQLERLLAHGREPSRSSHGIGFRVVRELVAASSGDLRVMSAPGIGTRVQIEWQMVAASSTEGSEGRLEPARGLMPDRLSGYSGPPRLGGMRRMNGPLGAHRMADVRELPGTREPKTTSSQTVEPNLGATGRPSC